MRSNTLYLFLAFIIITNTAFSQFTDVSIIDSESTGTSDICSGDINNDDLPDIVLSKAYNQMKISYYLNQGAGSFGEEQVIFETEEVFNFYQVACADFNADNFDDIVFFNNTNGEKGNLQLVWMQNNEGSFSDPVTIDSDLGSSVEIICKDIDNDNDIDIIIDDDLYIILYKNDGAGNFTPPIILIGEDEYYDMDVFDFNGDGYNDIIAAGALNITLLWNDTEGNFPTHTYVEEPPFGLYFTIACGDFDNDNDNDFVQWIEWAKKLIWFSNDGNGNFSEMQELVSGFNFIASLSVSDVDLDNDLDILSAYNQSSIVFWFENDGAGNFSDLQIIYDHDDFIGLSLISVFDIDLDGDEEVIWAATQGPLAYHDNLAIMTSVNDKITNSNIDFFPNPATETIYFNKTLTEHEVVIYNQLGKQVLKENIANNKINVSTLLKGIYIIEVNLENEKYTTKLIIK